MPSNPASPFGASPALVFADTGSSQSAIPIWLVRDLATFVLPQSLGATAGRWFDALRGTLAPKRHVLIPGADGAPAGVVFFVGSGVSGDPCGPPELLTGLLAQTLPPGDYYFAGEMARPDLAALSWGLGAYRYRRYKGAADMPLPRLQLPEGVDAALLKDTVEATWFGRDLINTPASDMGPEDLEQAARALALRHGAEVNVVVGDDLLARNFPMIHAVGRASTRAPRLIDITWVKPSGQPDAPRVTLVGKGVCFDTGGLDIKTAPGMLLMKKDMGGAAAALALGHMIMRRGLDVRLRILIPAVENSIAGNAFRPTDVLRSRAGLTVEVGDTDAEGRLILADALALADEEAPRVLITLATLTGAARVALGPDLPAMFTDDDAFAARLGASGSEVGDPVWRLPFWTGYERHLDSDVADMNNIFDIPFAGAIAAALFLRRFVRRARTFVHLDIYGWRPASRPLGPKGGETHAARAVFAALEREFLS